MWSSVSITVANLVMEDVEDRALQSYHSPPLFWKRYIDDVCAAVHEDYIQEFKDHIKAQRRHRRSGHSCMLWPDYLFCIGGCGQFIAR